MQESVTTSNETQASRASLMGAIDRLTLNPGPAMEVLETAEGDPDALIAVLERSPVLAGRVMGVANSAACGGGVAMTSIERCVRHLGARHARTVALALAMRLLVQESELDEALLDSLWHAATLKAVAARMVAEVMSPNDVKAASSAFAVGLLEDLALPVVAAADPKFFEDSLTQGDGKQSWVQRERDHFGMDHAELGALMLQQWEASPDLIRAVAGHHEYLEDDKLSDEVSPALLSQLAGSIAGLLPHQSEQSTQAQARWFAAVHARLLMDGYESPDAFIAEARRRAKLIGAKPMLGSQPKDFLERIIRSVSNDTFALTSQVTRLDYQLGQQTHHLAGVQHDAMTDVLSGLMNRRGFNRIGQQILTEAARSEQSVACVMVDLDDFKQINDTYGHEAGDRVLKAVAELLKTSVNAGDLAARLGGDEFSLLLIGSTQGEARAALERIHANCNGRELVVNQEGDKVRLSLSIGGIHLKQINADVATSSLLDAADKLMYQCKRDGKAGLAFRAVG